MRTAAALRVRAWIQQGALDHAQGWAREQGLSPDVAITSLNEYECVTLARLLLARRDLAAAHALLTRLLQAAHAGGRSGSAIEILMLHALAHQAGGDRAAALAALRQALDLAEPEGYVRLFADEGQAMADLLREAAAQDIAPDYVSRLMAALDGRVTRSVAAQSLVEPLTERELDVLRLLHTELNGPEIARSLTISLSTMRTHTRNIYAKLGVNHRRAAVRRAEEIALL